MFNFIKELSFVRIAGSNEEKIAANMICNKVKELGYEAVLEPFKIPFSNVSKQVCIINNKEYNVTASLRSKSIKGNFKLEYIEHLSHIYSRDLEGKVALIYTRLSYKYYEQLAKKNVAAIICASGTLYDDLNSTDLEINIIRDKHLEYGYIPCFTMRILDIEDIVKNDYHEIYLESEIKDTEVECNNVVVNVKGKKKEIITLTAHYDSVFFSTGSYDNASGTATLLDILSRINKGDLSYSLRFIFCAAEERGLLGSKYHVSISDNIKDVILNINVDMTGVTLGYDLCCVTANDKLCTYVDVINKTQGFDVETYSGTYSSDSTCFADAGICALTFSRDAYPNGKVIHSNKDNMDFMSERAFNHTCDIIYNFLKSILDAKYLPFSLEISDAIKSQIDKYFLRKQ